MTLKLFHSLLCLAALIPVIRCSKSEEGVYETVFKPYNKFIRPVEFDGDRVTVKLGITLSQIVDVDEKNQILTLIAWVRQVWTNSYLRWNATKFGGLTSMNVPAAHLWLPDVVLYGNADEDISFGGNLDRLNTRVIVHSSGLNQWLSPIMFKCKCKINVQYFPFDTQYCKIKFGSWTYDGFRVDIVNESSSADLGSYSESAEWKLVGMPAERNELYYFCCPEPYPDVTFTLIIQRRSLFYLMNLILPLVIITVLTNISFLLPPESGERVSLAITILLAMTVFMLLVAETIPPTSDVVPLIAKFYIASMVEMAFGLLATCFILKYYHSDPSVHEVPRWIKKYVIGYFSKIFRVKIPRHIIEANRQYFKEMDKKRVVLEDIMDREEVRGCDKQKDTLIDNAHTPILRNGDILKSQTISKPTGIASRTYSNYEMKLDTIIQRLDVIINNFKAQDRIERIQDEWRVAALILDRIALWGFFVTICITTIACFLQAPEYIA